MPDIFDNFFGKMSTRMHGGKSTPHYSGASKVNTGSYYSYHSNSTNNNYWLPQNKVVDGKVVSVDRKLSITSLNSEEMSRSRNGSVVSENLDTKL